MANGKALSKGFLLAQYIEESSTTGRLLRSISEQLHTRTPFQQTTKCLPNSTHITTRALSPFHRPLQTLNWVPNSMHSIRFYAKRRASPPPPPPEPSSDDDFGLGFDPYNDDSDDIPPPSLTSSDDDDDDRDR
eukprot:c21117_g1_i2 orf=604-1002(-)